MDVNESTLRTILEGSKQYVVPLYQRAYSWSSSNWNKIWDDLVDLARARAKNGDISHFTGTLVLDTGSVTPDLTKFLVVDGQQRLTTLSLLLAAICKTYENAKDENSATKIRDQVLVNKWASETERYRLQPANFDAPAFHAAINGTVLKSSDSLVDDAFAFFLKKLAKISESDLSLQEIELAALVGLKFVTITTKSEDNVYRIFESINNTGIDLSQADLIRNLVFMKLGSSSEHMHNKIWLPMQKDMESGDLENLFWIESLWRNPEVRKRDTYAFQKSLISTMSHDDLISYLENVNHIAEAIKIVNNPTRLDSSDLKLATLEKLNRLNIPGALVLTVRIVYLEQVGAITAEDAAKALSTVLSYLVRRAIANVPVNSVGGISAACATNLDEDAHKTVHEYLSTGKKKFITNAEIRRVFTQDSIYRRRHLFTILEWLLQEQQIKENVIWNEMTIEHVLPQNPTDEGKAEFASLITEGDPEAVYESIVDTIGNLTLTVYNSKLSNDPFAKKRSSWLSVTGVISTLEIAKSQAWGPSEISDRANLLADIAERIWEGPDESLLDLEIATVGERIDEIVGVIPPGRWASYGDVAEVAGTASMVVGNRVSTEGLSGAWRVLKANGKVSKKFKWGHESQFAGKTAIEVLESEGIPFDEDGFASPEHRLSTEALRERLGEE